VRAAALLLALAGCAAGVAQPVPDQAGWDPPGAGVPLPFAVTARLPRGVGASAVVVRDNCYGYSAGGTIYPVTTPTGDPYCI
jgi:hypothetical protein